MQVNAEKGPTFLTRDSANLELDDVTTRKPAADVPVIRLDRCPGAIVRNSRSLDGTGVFLSTAPGELKSIVLGGNSLGRARRHTKESVKGYDMTPESPTEKQ